MIRNERSFTHITKKQGLCGLGTLLRIRWSSDVGAGNYTAHPNGFWTDIMLWDILTLIGIGAMIFCYLAFWAAIGLYVASVVLELMVP